MLGSLRNWAKKIDRLPVVIQHSYATVSRLQIFPKEKKTYKYLLIRPSTLNHDKKSSKLLRTANEQPV